MKVQHAKLQNSKTYEPPSKETYEISCEQTEKNQAKYGDYYYQSRHTNVFDIRDIVYIKKKPVWIGEPTKLQTSYSKMLSVIIAKYPESDTYRVKNWMIPKIKM